MLVFRDKSLTSIKLLLFVKQMKINWGKAPNPCSQSKSAISLCRHRTPKEPTTTCYIYISNLFRSSISYYSLLPHTLLELFFISVFFNIFLYTLSTMKYITGCLLRVYGFDGEFASLIFISMSSDRENKNRTVYIQ